jgi:hypothetical protein
MSDTKPQEWLETVGSSSDSSSGSDSDHPHTPSPAAPHIRANADGPCTAPSKIPKMSTAATHPLSHSQPATPMDSSAASLSLNWGGVEWSILAEEVERKSTEMLPDQADDGVLSKEDPTSERDGGQITTSDAALVQSPTKFSGSFSDYGCASTYDAEHAHEPSQSKEPSDEANESVAPDLRVVHQPSSAPEVLHAAAIPETELSDTDASHASESDESSTQESADQLLCGPKDYDTATMPEVELSDPDTSSSSDSTESVEQDIPQLTFEPKSSNAATMLETEVSDTDVSHDSDSGESVTQEVSQPNIGPRDSDAATIPERELMNTDASPGSRSGESATKDIIQPTFEPEPKDPDTTTMLETELSDTDASNESDSDVSIMQLPTVRIRGPFLNIAMQDRAVKSNFGPSPQTILRGLIRDAHREMMYFTLPHSQFSLNDLRQGLDFAYSMLQAVTCKLAILNSLQDVNDANHMSAADLRRWIAHVDHLDPQTRHEPRILAIFESLSAGELKTALAELVQSRIIVEDEVKQARASLMDLVNAREEKLSVATSAVDVAVHDKGLGGCSTLCAFLDAEEPSWDALLTVVMVALFGALYISVRE